jgi:transcriptional regulator with XRE-family HTH domain
VIDRAGLADFLRRRREVLRPSDVGLPTGFRRRTPGLRRDEVALLAGMSTDYYARLEQGRGPRPSAQILTSLGRALRFDADQNDHLFHLAGLTPALRRSNGHIRPGLIRLADHLVDVPVTVVSDLSEVLWQNELADLTLGRRSPQPGRERNFGWLWFTRPELRDRFPREDWPHHAAAHVNNLRATAARRAGDPDVESLVSDLLAASTEFADLWDRHDVAVRRYDEKRIVHPEVGLIHLTCEVLLTPSADVQLMVYFPTEGTDASEKLDLLRVIGSQDLSSMR